MSEIKRYRTSDDIGVNLCVVCGNPVQYGSRHHMCGQDVKRRNEMTNCFDQDPNEQARISGADFSAMCDEMKQLQQRNAELKVELMQIRERKKISVGAIVDAFLGWKLPTDFSPDAGISFDCEYGKKWGMPTGTNLLHAGQAQQMIEHILCGCEPKLAQEIPSELVKWANSWQEDDSDMPSYLIGCNDMKHFVKSQLEKMKGGA